MQFYCRTDFSKEACQTTLIDTSLSRTTPYWRKKKQNTFTEIDEPTRSFAISWMVLDGSARKPNTISHNLKDSYGIKLAWTVQGKQNIGNPKCSQNTAEKESMKLGLGLC